jgi:hypothetical protein
VLWRSVVSRGWLVLEAAVRGRLVEAECDVVEFAMAANRPASCVNAGGSDVAASASSKDLNGSQGK